MIPCIHERREAAETHSRKYQANKENCHRLLELVERAQQVMDVVIRRRKGELVRLAKEKGGEIKKLVQVMMYGTTSVSMIYPSSVGCLIFSSQKLLLIASIIELFIIDDLPYLLSSAPGQGPSPPRQVL